MTRRADAGALGLAGGAGASLWISVGTQALTASSGVRLGTLPSPLLLAGGIVLAIAAAWVLRLRTREAWPLALTLVLWLPWLPLPVPAAALLWDGPLEWLVWCAALAGVVVALVRTAREAREGQVSTASDTAVARSTAGRDPWILAGGVLACALVASIAVRQQIPGGDEPHYLVITQSLLYDGDLRIENNHQRGDYRTYHPADLPPHYLRRGADGQIYSVHAPGLSALVLPAFAVAGYRGAVLVVAVLAAAAAWLMWRTAYRLTASASAAWLGAGSVAVSAPFFLHAFTIFPDPVGAVVVAVAAAWLTSLTLTPEVVTPRAAALVGGTLALLPWLHTRFSLIAAAFGLVSAVRCLALRRPLAERLRVLGSFGMLPAISALAWFGLFVAIYDTPNPAAPYGGSRQNAVAWLPAGLAGLAFDQQFGVLTAAPVLALVPFGWYLLLRCHSRLAIDLAVIAVPYTLLVASFAMWWGGRSAPGRFLVPLLPLAAPLLALAWKHGGAAVRAVLVALAVLGALNTGARVLLQDGVFIYNVRDGYDLLLRWLSPAVSLPLALPSLHRTGTEVTLLVASVWLVALAAAGLVLAIVFERRALGAGVRWTATSTVVVLAAMVAMTASWRVVRAQPLTPVESQVAWLRGWTGEGWTVALPSWTRVPPQAAPLALGLTAGSAHPLLSVAVYGDTHVAAIDAGFYVEPQGVWTMGDSRAEILVASAATEIAIEVMAGPVPVTLAIRTLEGERQIRLAPDERRRLALPPGRWQVDTVGGFRPRDHADTGDERWLGVRLQFP